MATLYYRGGPGTINGNAITAGTNAAFVTNAAAARVTASRAGTTLTVTAIASGALAVGQKVVSAANTSMGTISAQLTGSAGSTGTYTVSGSGTVASTTMTGFAVTGSTTTITSADSLIADSYSINGTGSASLTLSGTGLSVVDFDISAAPASLTIASTGTTALTGNLSVGPQLWSNTGLITFNGTGAQTLSSTTGNTLSSPVTVNKAGGTLTVTTNIGMGTLTLTQGGLDIGTKSVACNSFVSNNSNARSITVGSGGKFLTASWNCATATNLTTTGTVLLDSSGGNNLTYVHGSVGGSSTNCIAYSGTGNSGAFANSWSGHFSSINWSSSAGSTSAQTFSGVTCYGAFSIGSTAATIAASATTLTINNTGQNVSIGPALSQPVDITGAAFTADITTSGTLTLTNCSGNTNSPRTFRSTSTGASAMLVSGFTMAGSAAGTQTFRCSGTMTWANWAGSTLQSSALALQLDDNGTGVARLEMNIPNTEAAGSRWMFSTIQFMAAGIYYIRGSLKSTNNPTWTVSPTSNVVDVRFRNDAAASSLAVDYSVGNGGPQSLSYPNSSAKNTIQGYNGTATPGVVTLKTQTSTGTTFVQNAIIKNITLSNVDGGVIPGIAAAPNCTDGGGNTNWTFGSVLTATITETQALAETVNGATTLLCSQIDSMAFNDTLNGSLAIPSTVTETMAMTSTQDIPVTIHSVSITEVLVLGDTLGGTVTFTATQSDSMSMADTVNGVAILSAAQSDSMSMADTIDVGQSFSVTIVENMVMADSTNGSHTMLAAIVEAMVMDELISAVGSFFGTIVESMTLIDSSSAIASMIADQSEALVLGDMVDGAASLNSSIVESMTLNDMIDGVALLHATISESMTLVDVSTASALFFSDITESMTLIDVTDTDIILGGSIVESLSLMDSVDAIASLFATVEESLSLADVLDAATQLYANMDESMMLDDVIGAMVFANGGMVESMNLTDHVGGVVIFRRPYGLFMVVF